ncbi:hypothetical protein SAMN05892883_2771 [Jatrophihabitans sp. GAS493]|uniref:hypothetical protein n=1 Tax=Jatrophihabitans sp. GAS493 TaxID=1907575 RepID=UPI000BBFA199|nr:hypothetical protein [Jatrophihabitans sp. GAS493]SOD73476.1 hypothetical protein SAMN05892883_2771 [Jatrophihabitans sp. GAS493]
MSTTMHLDDDGVVVYTLEKDVHYNQAHYPAAFRVDLRGFGQDSGISDHVARYLRSELGDGHQVGIRGSHVEIRADRFTLEPQSDTQNILWARLTSQGRPGLACQLE